MDLFFITIAAAFFVLSRLLVRLAERLMEGKKN